MKIHQTRYVVTYTKEDGVNSSIRHRAVYAFSMEEALQFSNKILKEDSTLWTHVITKIEVDNN